MHLLKLLNRTTTQLARQGRLFLQSIFGDDEQKRLQTVRIDLEAERLDRIRNPSKYRGR